MGLELAWKAWLGLDWGRKRVELVPGRQNVSTKLETRLGSARGRVQPKQKLEAGEVLG